MSRTYKDVPYEVDVMHRKPRIVHRHDLLGKRVLHRQRRHLVFSYDDVFTDGAYESARGHLDEWVASLRDVCGSDYHVDYKSQPDYVERSFVDRKGNVNAYMQTVIAVSVHIYKMVQYSNYCTDLAHYNRHGDTDTRDGKLAACRPLLYENYLYYKHQCRCFFCCREAAEYKSKRHHIKTALNQLRKIDWNDADMADTEWERLELPMFAR